FERIQTAKKARLSRPKESVWKRSRELPGRRKKWQRAEGPVPSTFEEQPPPSG
ncbi:hypothetical protein Pmar_PMAR000928, partial [Perkinsus marinus ATCC 50983]